MMTTASRWAFPGLGFLVVLSLLLILAGCTQAEETPQAGTITVSMLIQVEDKDTRWFRDVEVPKGTNAWELTERVTGGDVGATFSQEYRSHFVNSIFGVKSESPRFWLIYVWSEPQGKWASLPVGADLFSLKDGHILAWYYTDTTEMTVPPVTP